MKRVLVWLIALNACGVLAVVGYGFIGFGPVHPTGYNGIVLAAAPFLAAVIISLPLFQSVRGLGRTSRQSLRTTLLCVVPAAVGIPSLGAMWFFIEDQVISGWPFFVFVHLGYLGVLLLCVMTVHGSLAMCEQHVSHPHDRMLVWTDGIVKGLFVTWLPTFLCFLASVWLFPVLYALVVLVTGAHFALLYRAVGNMEAASEPSSQVET